jgi:hypothetical protein
VELNELRDFLSHSPALRLFRAQNGAMILAFFFRVFKHESRITIPQDQLLAELADFQESIAEIEPGMLPNSPQEYLNSWCKADVRFLHRFFQGGSDEPVYQLTAATEAALRFVQETLERESGSVGAESCVHVIVETLKDLAVYGLGDPTHQIALLEAERNQIQRKIDRIRQTGKPEVYEPAQTREKFAFAMDLLRRVTSDFRQVEDKFKAITREVQDRQMAGDHKGGLLEYVLDAETLLKESDQGRSFYGFVNLILSPARQEQLRQVIEQVLRIESLAHQEEDRETLLGMIPSLTAEAELVMQTIQRLSASITRLLDGRIASERRQVALTIDEILKQARQARNEEPLDAGLEIESEFRVFSPFSRPFWSPSSGIEAVALQEDAAPIEETDEAFDLLAQMRRLDWEGMRENVRELTAYQPSVSLPRLLQEHPPRSGAVEVLAYIQIAEEGPHLVDATSEDEVPLPTAHEGAPQRALRIPRVIFRQTETRKG